VSIPSAVTFGFTASIFLSVLAVGMQVAPADLRFLLRQPKRLFRSLVTMYVVTPLVVMIVCRAFSLHPAVTVGLVTLSIAPVGALFPKVLLPLISPERAAYAHGLFFASTALSVVLTPLGVEALQAIYNSEVDISPFVTVEVVAVSVLLPLGVGLGIGHWWPQTLRWIPAVEKLSSLVLLVCQLALIAVTWSLMASLMREGTLIAIVLIAFLMLSVGHLFGGPDADNRTVLAIATVSRHPGVAIALASLTNQPLAPVGVLLAVVVSEIAAVPYKLSRKRLRSLGPA